MLRAARSSQNSWPTISSSQNFPPYAFGIGEGIICGVRAENKALRLACLQTLIHYTGACMRVPVLPLYARSVDNGVAQQGRIVITQKSGFAGG